MTDPTSTRPVVRAAGVALACALLILPAGCSGGAGDYCETLASHRSELTSLAGGAAGITEAMPVFEELAGKAPDDLVDEWQTVLNALRGFVDAARKAGVTLGPDTRSQLKNLPADKRASVEAAAGDLASAPVTDAAEGIEAHARDVCKVDLSG